MGWMPEKAENREEQRASGSEMRPVVPFRWVHQGLSFRQRTRLSIGTVSILSRALGCKTPVYLIDWKVAFGKAGVLSFPHGSHLAAKSRSMENPS
jgi:hypothetical protein